MKRRLAPIFWLFMTGLLLAGPVRAARYPPTDSLRHLARWPLATQRRLASIRIEQPGPWATAAEELARRHGQGLAPGVYLELIGSLAGYYIHQKQASLAIARLLEVRQRAWADSARSGNAAVWLSYCYGMLREPAPGLAYSREALRRLPRAGSSLGDREQAYYMLADCAVLVPNYALADSCYHQALTLARRQRDSLGVAVSLASLSQMSVYRRRYALAARQLAASRAAADARAHPGILMTQDEQAARLALALGRYRPAELALRPALRRALGQHQPIWEAEVRELLVPALAGQGRYREALAHQQHLRTLEKNTFEESANRRAQELQVVYATARREQELARQRQRIAALQAQQQVRTAEYGRRLAGLGAAVLAALLLLTLGLVAGASRQRRLRAQREEKLRSRIAADLHDEVGTLLARVSMQADLLNQQQPEPNPALLRLLGNSRAAAGTMRDIVWGIDAHADTVGALLDRIRDHLDQSAAPAGLRTHLHTEGLPDALPLPAELRQHLYLIFKEAVTNAVRHAVHPTGLAVSLARCPATKTLLLAVEDDGRPGPAPARSGMGLRNMRHRAAALRGQLEVGPRPAGGYQVRLRIPF